MGQTQHTVGTANVRASCIALLVTGNIGGFGNGANIFRGHDNVQGTLARLRRDLAELGLRRSPDIAEPEDHAAILCELMSGLACRQWPALSLARMNKSVRISGYSLIRLEAQYQHCERPGTPRMPHR